MSLEEARTHVLRKDEIRKRFVESDMHFSYTDTIMFDIILDTSLVPVEDCVRVLTNGVNNRMSHPEDVQKSVKSIEVAPVLKEYLNEMLSRFTAEDSKA